MSDETSGLPDFMRRNVKAVHVRVPLSWQDRCESYMCDRRAVEQCGRLDARVCAVHLKEDTGCKAIHRTLAGSIIYR